MTVDSITATQMVDVIVKFNINMKQFLLLMILETDRLEGKGQIEGRSKENAIKNVYRLAQHLNEKWTFDEIDDLVEKGLLIDLNMNKYGAKREAYPDHYEVTELFTSAIMAQISDFEEFWEIYPGFCDNFNDIRGPKIPLKAVDYEEVERLYMKFVHTKAKHKVVMTVLKWAIETDQANMSIQKYVSSRMWDQHMLLRKRSLSNPMTRLIN